MEEKCQECDAALNVPDDAIVGEVVRCRECGSEFEVAEIRGKEVKLKAAELAEEDWGE